MDQVDSELAKNEKMDGEIAEMRSLMEHERATREDLRKRFQEINKIRQDREKVMYGISYILLKYTLILKTGCVSVHRAILIAILIAGFTGAN